MKKGTLIGLAVFLFAGCGTVERGTIPWKENTPESPAISSSPENEKGKSTSDSESGSFVESSMPPSIQEKQEFLELAYSDWKGTPYLLGGSGYDGIDCSAFMQVVFEDYFGMQIPRTTREQLQAGKEVKKSQILTGDLVFFKTGRTTYHVGVMINRKEFLHASTTNGVKISGLDHPYWVETYLTSKRLF